MKRIALLLFSICTAISSEAQNEVNYWMGGIHAMIKFDSDGAHDLYRPDYDQFVNTTASISDSAGNLLFYTNGYDIFNRDFQIMQNGSALNMGDYIQLGQYFIDDCDGIVIIPIPGKSQQYYLFHVDDNFINTANGPDLFPTHIFCCTIDMSLDSGRGGVVDGEKDLVVMTDTLTDFGLKAVKHANGRDWWLVCHEYGTSRYFRLLVDPYGIHGPYYQDMGIVYQLNTAHLSSPMKFYTNDEQFAHCAYDSNIVELADFDRCSGEFYNYKKFAVNDSSYYIDGISLSPNGRYIYVSSYDTASDVLQFDLSNADIHSTRTIVGTSNGAKNPFACEYQYQEVGPDGRTYVMDYDGCYAISLINHPDSAGKACGFVQYGFPLDSATGQEWTADMPNIPHYALGALPGACDTLTGVQQLPAPVFTYGVYPNPFTSQLNIGISGAQTDAEISVYNLLGEKEYYAKQKPSNGFIYYNINLSSLSAGMYIVIVQVNGRQYERKVVKK